MGNVSFIYSVPYLIVILLLLLLYRKERKLLKSNRNPQIVREVSFVILLIFIGLRGFQYTDFVNYYVAFERIPKLFDLTINDFKYNNTEIGFFLSESFFKSIIDNYHVWIFFNSLIDLLLIRNIFQRYSSSTILPFIFFFAYWGLQFEFNLMRNVKGLLFFLISLKSLEIGNFKRYFFFNLLGCLFHVSSLVYIVVYPFLRMNWKKGLLLVIFLCINIIYLSGFYLGVLSANFILDYLGIDSSEKIMNYLSNASEIGITIGYIERLLEMFLFIVFLDKLRVVNKYADIFISCALLYFGLYCLFSDVAIFVQRFPLLFIVGYWILLANLFQISFKNRKVVLVLLLCMCVCRTSLSNNSLLAEYDNIIWGIKSYEEKRNIVYNLINEM